MSVDHFWERVRALEWWRDDLAAANNRALAAQGRQERRADRYRALAQPWFDEARRRRRSLALTEIVRERESRGGYDTSREALLRRRGDRYRRIAWH